MIKKMSIEHNRATEASGGIYIEFKDQKVENRGWNQVILKNNTVYQGAQVTYKFSQIVWL